MAEADGEGTGATDQPVRRAEVAQAPVLAVDGPDPADEVGGRDDRIRGPSAVASEAPSVWGASDAPMDDDAVVGQAEDPDLTPARCAVGVDGHPVAGRDDIAHRGAGGR